MTLDLGLDWRFIARLIPALLDGAKITVQLSILTMAITLIWGLVIAGAELSGGVLRPVTRGYVQIARNVPLLIQIYFAYFGLALAGLSLSGFSCGLLALCVQNGAITAEIYRGGLNSVGLRQYEAGYSLGMSRWTLLGNVIFPQVVARVVPPLTNQGIAIVKDTSLVTAIGVMDIMKVTNIWVEQSAATYEVFVTVMVLYIVLTSVVSVVGRLVERWWMVAV